MKAEPQIRPLPFAAGAGEWIVPVGASSPAGTFARSATPDETLDPPFGTFALPRLTDLIRRATGVIPFTEVQRRVARKLMGGWGQSPRRADVVALGGARLRLHDDNTCERKAVVGNHWNSAERRVLRSMVANGDKPFVFVDAGANVGFYSLDVLRAARRRGRSADVLCIEPDAENGSRLAANLERNAVSARLAAVALSDEDGVAFLGGSERSRGTLRLGTHGVSVPAKRLSTVLDQAGVANIHALKIDLEGMDRWVLEDFFEMAPAALRPGLIICEVGRNDPSAIVPFLQTRGYRVLLAHGPTPSRSGRRCSGLMSAGAASAMTASILQVRTACDDWTGTVARPLALRSQEGALLALTDGRAPHDPDRASVVVLGAARSGTTLCAGVLQILGVEFGDRVSDVAEDVDLNAALRRTRSGLRSWSAPLARRQFARILAERRAKWMRFGFKAPALTRQLWLMAGVIPNASYVCVLRSPVATASSAYRRGGSNRLGTLASTTMRQDRIVRFARRTRRPCIIVGYETMLASPDAVVRDLDRFLKLDAGPARCARAAGFVNREGGYIKPTRRSLGEVETATPQHVAGWAGDLAEPERPVTVEIYAGNQMIARTIANRPRPDVVAGGRHISARCGFEITLPDGVPLEGNADLVVKLPELGHELRQRGRAPQPLAAATNS